MKLFCILLSDNRVIKYGLQIDYLEKNENYKKN